MLMLYGFMGLLGIIFYLTVRTRHPRRILLSDSFFFGLAIFFLGSWIGAVQKPDMPAGASVLLFSVMALNSAAFTVAFLKPYNRRLVRSQVEPPRLRPEYVMAMSLFLAFFNLGFTYLVYTLLLDGSLELLADEGGLLTVRKWIASGDRGYFFPGLVKQVRDVFAPALVFYLLSYSAKGKNRISFFLVISTTLVAMFFGGQRSPILVLGVAVYFGLRERTLRFGSGERIRRHPIRLLIYGVVVIAAMGFINQLLGRGSTGLGLVEMVGESAVGVFGRIVTTVPISNIDAFEFVSEYDPGFAALWLDGLAGLLPGTQTGLSNEMHEYLGGSFQGNAVLGFPVSSYINLGVAGVLLLPMLIMSVLTLFDRNCSRINSPLLNSARMAMLVYLPIAYDPATFLLSGGLVFIAVFSWIYFMTSRGKLQPSSR